MDEKERGYYMVRAMSQQKADFELFFQQSVVAVGWSKVDFSAFPDPKALVAQVRKAYYAEKGRAPQIVGRELSGVWRFKNMREGDRIIVPFYSSVCLAIARSEENYEASISDTLDLSNQRRVIYQRQDNGEPLIVPRKELSEGLARRLSVRGSTCADLSEFADEIERLFTGRNLGWSSFYEEKQTRLEMQFKDKLLSNIQIGRTNLQAGGIGLEQLVRELLQIEGYQARVLPKTFFPGFADADIVASRLDRCVGQIDLLVQVKHHSGASDPWGAQQLKEVRKQIPKEYDDHQLILVTTADASGDLRCECEAGKIRLITGSELKDWLFESVPKLSATTRTKLGIADVPQLIV